MPKLPRISGLDVVRAFVKSGFEHVRTKGSHYVLKKPGNRFLLSIPVHKGKTVGVGLLKSQIEAAGLTVDEFIDFAK